MAVWSITFNQIVSSIVHLFKEQTSRKVATYTEQEVIRNSVNEALQQLSEERGVPRWEYNQAAIQLTCVANQKYVDLPTTAMTLITGTVRIETEEQYLSPISMEALYGIDIDRDETGVPSCYAHDTTAAGVTRLQLYPVPDSAYTIDAYCESINDTSSIASLPPWFIGCVLDLATAIAMRRLGFGNPLQYMMAYEHALLNHKDKQGYDGPTSINRHQRSTAADNAFSAAYSRAIRS
jgi:hypothetical protein